MNFLRLYSVVIVLSLWAAVIFAGVESDFSEGVAVTVLAASVVVHIHQIIRLRGGG